MERLESIRDVETSNDMNSLLPYLKTLTPSKVTFVSFSQDLQVNIRNGSGLYDEDEIKQLNSTLYVYCGTTKDTHYVATITTTNPSGSMEIGIRECLKLPMEMCDIIGYASSLIKFNNKFSFCPRCGNKMSYAGYGTHQSCLNCKNVCFPRTDPCIIVVIRHPTERKCLFVKKAFMPEKRYTCVAGFLEVGESIEECVKRETWEEVKLRVTNVKYVTSSAYPINLTNQIMIGCSADALNDDIDRIPGNELSEAFWVDEDTVKRAIIESQSEKPNGVYTVPPSYIAHQLFQHWVDTK
ncbi:NAD(+) diphosphatase [Entamoeba marina]